MSKMTKPASFRGLSGLVRADAGDANRVLGELRTAVQAMRDEHAAQIADLRRGQEDVVRAEKIDRINADIGELQVAFDRMTVQLAARSVGAGGAGRQIADADYTNSFVAHMRRGEVQASLNKGTSADGGYLTPIEWDRTIIEKLRLISPMRQICRAMTISTAGFTTLFNLGGYTSGWVAEMAARPATATPTFGQMTYTPQEFYANPGVTQQFLDDAELDVEDWLAEKFREDCATQEGLAFVSGSGAGVPAGILTYVTGGANAAVHPFGAIQLVASGHATAITVDSLISLVYDLPQAFTANAKWAMNHNTLGVCRKLKDGQGNLLWQPSYAAGQPQTLLGYPVVEVADMPNIAAGSVPVLFGDFERTYLIVDRMGTRVLRDPFSSKPYVHFYCTKRVGGGLLNPQPMRGLRVAAS